MWILNKQSHAPFYTHAPYFGHLMWRTDSLEKTLMLRKVEGRRRRGQQRLRCWMASPIGWTWVSTSSGSWWWTAKSCVLLSMGFQRGGHNWVSELNWTEHVLINKIVTNDKKKKKRRRYWQGLRKSSNQRIVTQKNLIIQVWFPSPALTHCLAFGVGVKK